MSGRWIWGRRPVLEALRSHMVRSILLSEGVRDAAIVTEIRRAALESGVELHEVPDSEIERHAPAHAAQSIVAELRSATTVPLNTILEVVKKANGPALLLVTDEVQDPHNLGSLLRSAESAGAQGAIVTERRSAPLTGTVTKASAGALFHLPVATVTNLISAISALKDQGIWTVGLSERAEQSLYGVDLTVPVAIVVGGEGRGLRRLTSAKVDIMASLPMLGSISSLNASVAGAIALYEVVRQRRPATGDETGPSRH
ncbi:MAG TPA: 23S rRNA (guanosine(2251)-2'-O)-methyltransferase RlmB [Chloroflexota bacterium]|nr:23S rRNA (guanosine(2251)-2'-O)-methyltransferase RlmB [Chloroflexota bacterium]